jgi:monoamine oxidase
MAARDLGRAGWRVHVLEARPRAGGRIHTLHDHEWPLPVELGAEFIHGAGADVRAAAEAAGLTVEELPDVHVWSEGTGWEVLSDFYGDVESVLAPAGERRRDTTFDDLLRSRRTSRRRRELARLYVEGYTAARPDRVSARWLAAGTGGDESAHRQYRPTGGYGALVRSLLAGLDRSRVTLHLNHVVTRVEWRRRAAAVECRTVTGERVGPFRAQAVVVSLPLGVLKASDGGPGSVVFDPPLVAKTTVLGGLDTGQVCKVVLRFTERFWDDQTFLADRLSVRAAARTAGAINFWHDPRLAFPTWWTAAPRQAPVLTAWAGGPRAEALLARPEPERIARSLEALAALMRLPRAWLERRLESWAGHDWRADPYSRGAYSYALAGGESAAAGLARPLLSTLFFAGEATEAEESGTVQAALASGRRAAREVLAAAGRGR